MPKTFKFSPPLLYLTKYIKLKWTDQETLKSPGKIHQGFFQCLVIFGECTYIAWFNIYQRLVGLVCILKTMYLLFKNFSNDIQLPFPMSTTYTCILTQTWEKTHVHFMLGSCRLYLNLDNECNHAFVWMHVYQVTANQRRAKDNLSLIRRAYIFNLIYFDVKFS